MSSPDLPPALLAFLDLYAEGRFWDSHEVLEGPWREGRSDFYQGLILYASAFVHWKKGNAHGVGAQTAKALERLISYPPSYLGLDVQAIREHCVEVRDTLDRHPDEWADRISPLPLGAEHARIRGDEVELGGGGAPNE